MTIARSQGPNVECPVADELVALTEALAHSLRNPLFGISATLEAFAQRVGDDTSYKAYTDVLLAEVGRLKSILRDLDGLVGAATLDRSPTSMKALLDEVLAAQAGAVAADMLLPLPLGIPDAVLLVDRVRLRAIFSEIIACCLNGAIGGGQVRLGVETTSRLWRCTVENDGGSAANNGVKNLFTLFSSCRGGGSGLASVVALLVVQAHGGALLVQPTERGARVTLELPLNQESRD